MPGLRGAPALLQQPRTPTPHPRCLGPGLCPPSASPHGWQRAGCMQWWLLGPAQPQGSARYQYWLFSLLAVVPLVSHDCTFVGHEVIHTCITWSLDAEVPICHPCLIAPPCCTDRIKLCLGHCESSTSSPPIRLTHALLLSPRAPSVLTIMCFLALSPVWARSARSQEGR